MSITNKLGARAVAVLTMATTLLSLSGFAAFAPIAVSTAQAVAPADYGLKEGDTISAAGSNDPDVYIVNSWGYKRLFLNPIIFTLYGHLSWAGVKTVSPATRDAFVTSGLFRNCETNDAKVYGLEVTGEDTANLRWVNTSGAQAVLDDPNFFLKVFCINSAEQRLYGTGADFTSVLQVPAYSRGGQTTSPTPTPVAIGPINASLSADNPASGTVVAGQSIADLAHFHLMNPGSSPVAVNALQFKRIGISGDTTFANAYVYSNGIRLTDAVTPSSGVLSFNGGTSTSTIAVIPAFGAIDVAFKTDVLAGTSGQTIGVQLWSVNGVSVNNLTGNLFGIATAPSDLATATFGTSANLIPAIAGVTSDPLPDTIVWQDTLTIGNKNVMLKSLALRQTNSINNTDVQNFRLFVDGIQVAQVQNLDANGYVTFMPSSATILTGSRTVKVLADIIGGTSRKLTMSLRSTADVVLVDSNYGVNIGTCIGGTPGFPACTGGSSFPLTAGDITINSGSIVVQKDASSPSGNIVKGSSDVSLGRWLFTAYGEPVKVSTLIVGVHGSNAATLQLRNGRIMVYSPAGGPSTAVQYGSTGSLIVQPGNATASKSYTTNLTINPGSPMIVSIRADIYDDGTAGDTTAAGNTIQADLYTGSSNAQGMSSLTSTNLPTARNNANTLTIQAGSATIASFAGFTNQAVTAPRANTKIADFVVTGSTNEAINVNTLLLTVTSGAGSDLSNLSNVYLKYNGVATSVKSTIGSGTSTTSGVQTFSMSNTQLAVNGSVHIEVFADIGNVTAAGNATFQSTMQLQGTTVSSAQAVQTLANGSSSTSGTQFTGQTVTVAAGNVASAVDASTPAVALNVANNTVDVAKFNFTATNDTFNITELQLKTLASASQSAIQTVILKRADGGSFTSNGASVTSVALPLHAVGNSQVATFGSLSGFAIPANDPNGIVLTAAVQTGNVGVNAASTGLNVGLVLDYFKNTNSAGTLATDNNDRAGNAEYVYAAKPLVAAVSLPSTLLAPGTQTLSKFSVAASNGQIAWNQILLNVTKTSAVVATSASMQFLQDGVDIGPLGSGLVSFTFTSPLTFSAGTTSGTIKIVANLQTTELLAPTTPHVYELKVPITTTGTAGNSIITSFLRPTTTFSAPNTSLVKEAAGTVPSFVWSDRVGNGNMGGGTTVTVHSTTTPDWENDFLVNGLPLNGQSLSL